jgi:hypothetical protein
MFTLISVTSFSKVYPKKGASTEPHVRDYLRLIVRPNSSPLVAVS